MPTTTMAAFWAVSFLLVITPGADWAFAISAGIRDRALVIPAVLGLACGAMLATLAVAAGIGTLVARQPLLLSALTLLGALYLAWLGTGMLRSPASAHAATAARAPHPLRWAARGIGISGLNPKLVLLLLALLPQFVSAQARWPVTAQIMALGTIHAASCVAVYLAVGFSAQRVLASRPMAARRVSRLSGVLMIAIATGLMFEQAAPLLQR